MFKPKLNRVAHYSCENNLMSTIDFVFIALFQHYKLYINFFRHKKELMTSPSVSWLFLATLSSTTYEGWCT